MKSITPRTPVTVATIVSLLLLAIALAVLARGIRNHSESWRWVAHTREVLEHVEATLTLASDAETAQRGLLLTGNPVFLADYRRARDGVLPEVARLRTLTSDNPRQQAALRPFEDALRARLELLEQVVREKLAGRAPDMATLESGRLLKQRILAKAELVRSEERRLLEERHLRVEQGRRELIAAFATTAGVAGLLVVLLWVISSRDAARLLAERARLDATLRSIGDGVIATAPDGTVTLMNRVAEVLSGIPEAGAVGRRLDQVLHLREQDSGRPIRAAEAIGDLFDRAVLIAGEDREYAIELNMAPITPEGTEAVGNVMVFRDVTERNARGRALAESEANYRYTVELNPQMPWKASADGTMLFLSDRWLALTGQARDALIGSGWMEVIDADDRPAVAQAWKHAVSSGATYDVEHRVRTADGQVRWVRARANPRRDASGAIVAWYGLTEDIHARKESELALNRRLAQIETIYRAVPVGLALLDADMRLEELNDALADVSGRLKDAIVGMRLADVLPDPLNGQVGALVGQVALDRRQLAGVEFSVSGDGEEQQRDWLASFYPVQEGGHFQGIVVALLEVTQIKIAQRKLSEANQLLEQRVEQRTAQIAEANAELRAFAHTVAHDLRAPLRNVEGFATALMEDEADRMSEDGKVFAGRIVAAVVRMDRLITDLLGYSRLSRAELRFERVELGMAFKTALRDIETQIAESGARLDIGYPLPAVWANGTILAQVLGNLLSNAIKFVGKGVVPHIQVSAERNGMAVQLSIADNGIGIAAEHREQVFGVFERLHGEERYPGTGIGLAIVKKGLERLGGSVRIAGREAGGSVFELTMPAAD
ncbi:PAS domain-containing protein [Massilia sp. METH4]|uniref:sensor histidine kinase n=1 Tax=Massilia sp. METH4 TaxID=3123041 RepID=UPI0030CC98E8